MEEAATGEKKRGRKPGEPDEKPDNDAQANMTDPENRIMKYSGWEVERMKKNIITMAGLLVLAAHRIILAGYVAEDNPQAGRSGVPVEWVSIGGGKFTMGTDDGSDWFKNAKPIHEVNIKTFEMSKTLVTVEQYAECVIQGGCTEPGTGSYCNWGVAGRQRHPINCVDWYQANQYAKFKGARLPSESEYEYAATSGGKDQKYPWGNEDATSDMAVMSGRSGNRTMPVCSKPAGNAMVSGGELCDMAGSVSEWVQDKYQNSYADAPTDGSAFEGAGSYRVVRGPSFSNDASSLRADYRGYGAPDCRGDDLGFRLARSSRSRLGQVSEDPRL